MPGRAPEASVCVPSASRSETLKSSICTSTPETAAAPVGRDRHAHGGRIRTRQAGAAAAPAAAGAREQEPLLDVDRLEPRADARQVAGRRMAGRALPFAVEEGRARFGVAGQDVLDLEERRAAQRRR